jgi:hypothetical protein
MEDVYCGRICCFAGTGEVPAEAVDTRTNRRIQLYGREYEYVSEIIQVIQEDKDTIPGQITLYDRCGFYIPPTLLVTEVHWGEMVSFTVHISSEDRIKLYGKVIDEINAEFCKFRDVVGCGPSLEKGKVAYIVNGEIHLEQRYWPRDIWNSVFHVRTFEEGVVVYVKGDDKNVRKWRSMIPLFWKGIPVFVQPRRPIRHL